MGNKVLFAKRSPVSDDGRGLKPPFTDADATVGEDGKKRGPTDFNDLQQLRGVDAVFARQ